MYDHAQLSTLEFDMGRAVLASRFNFASWAGVSKLHAVNPRASSGTFTCGANRGDGFASAVDEAIEEIGTGPADPAIGAAQAASTNVPPASAAIRVPRLMRAC